MARHIVGFQPSLQRAKVLYHRIATKWA
jgi:hypothetical protein